MNSLELKLIGDTQAVVTRQFAASPEAVFRAHIEPELLQQWCTGPDGWTMPVCISDAVPGGEIRFEWQNDSGESFFLTGNFIELSPFSRIVHVERMHLPDPTPDNRVETTFEANESGTLLTMTMSLPDKETRDAMLATGMADGMEYGYKKLEALATGLNL